MANFGFKEFEQKEEVQNQQSLQVKEEKKDKKTINFQELPNGSESILNEQKEIIEKYSKEEDISMPSEDNVNQSHLSLILSPNLRDLELMIRGLEYKKRFNRLTGRDEIILQKIPGHPLNEYGVNKIMEFLRIYSSPEIKLGRKTELGYYNSIRQVGRDATRLVYKNLKAFGMDTQQKQRSAKTFVLAIIEICDAGFSRSIEGKENDLSRPTELKIEGSADLMNDPSQFFTKKQKEGLKN